MSTSCLSPTALLTPQEIQAIDAFGTDHQGLKALPALATFLQDELQVELSLDPDIVAGFTTDSSNLPGKAQALARPQGERECAILLRACQQAGIPLTVSGGKSNLTGSATPLEGVVLSTTRLLTPEVSVDVEARTVLTPPGILLEDMRNQVETRSNRALVFPVDPTSRSDASVGGCLACNASGFTPGETGAIRSWVQSLRFLLPDGRLIEAARGQYVSEKGAFRLSHPDGEQAWPLPTYPRPAIKNAGGPFSATDGRIDFVDLVIGSEGLFGLVTTCTLRLTDKPKAYLDIFFSLPTEAEALRLLRATLDHFQGDLSCISAFEYFGVHCRQYMKHEERFFHGTDEVAVYVQEPLFDREMEDEAEVWLEILAAAELDVDEEAILLLDSDALRQLFMEARHSMPANAIEVVQHRGTFTIMTDCVVPPEHFADFLAFTHERISSKGMDYLSFGHLGDCHLHFTILPTQAQIDDGVAAYDDIVAKSAECGGVYSGEHGTGKRKRKDFIRCYGPEAVAEVCRCKRAVDPGWLLNQGNVVAGENEA